MQAWLFSRPSPTTSYIRKQQHVWIRDGKLGGKAVELFALAFLWICHHLKLQSQAILWALSMVTSCYLPLCIKIDRKNNNVLTGFLHCLGSPAKRKIFIINVIYQCDFWDLKIFPIWGGKESVFKCAFKQPLDEIWLMPIELLYLFTGSSSRRHPWSEYCVIRRIRGWVG